MPLNADKSRSSIARKLAVVAAGVVVGAVVSLLYDGPFEASLGLVVGVATIALTELYDRG